MSNNPVVYNIGDNMSTVYNTLSGGINSPSYTFSNTSNVSNITPQLKVDGDILLNGKSVSEHLRKIEELSRRLSLLEERPELEKEYAELKELADAYHNKAKEIDSMHNVLDILKKSY